ncbi:MAG: hypothetical protein HUJ93_02980 [Bacteroidales bacterium]|nr:hypothetical protein [Bacteroidales bacterium]
MKKALLWITVAVVMATSCHKINRGEGSQETEQGDTKLRNVKKTIKAYMSELYYWYDRMPSESYTDDKVDIFEYFDCLLVPEDRWSWMSDAESYLQSETGVVTGTYGASFAQPIEYHNDYDIHVRFVYPDSPFDKAGVKRGWTMTHINGVAVMDLIRSDKFGSEFSKSPQTFTFNDIEGNPHTFTTSSSLSLNTRPGLLTKIFTSEDYPGLNEPVGYFHYLSFMAGNDAKGKPMMDDIAEAMGKLSEAGVKKMILDLRYNPGGDSRASDTLVGYIANAAANKKIYVKRSHNKKYQDKDIEMAVNRNSKSLNLDKLYIITGEGSASASEMVLNGLKPLMNVTQVGDTTYGKPNGMYVIYYPDDDASYDKYNAGNFNSLQYVFLPICFYNTNSLNEKIPDSGMIPDNYRPDDIYHDFDASEDNIAACLYHIVRGSYPALPEPHGYRTKASEGINAGLEAEKVENYGLYTVKMSDLH